MPLQIAEPAGPPSPAHSGSGQRLDKGPTGTGRVWAAEPPRANLDHDGTALPRQVLQPALVGAVHAPRQAGTAAGKGGGPGWTGTVERKIQTVPVRRRAQTYTERVARM